MVKPQRRAWVHTPPPSNTGKSCGLEVFVATPFLGNLSPVAAGRSHKAVPGKRQLPRIKVIPRDAESGGAVGARCLSEGSNLQIQPIKGGTYS